MAEKNAVTRQTVRSIAKSRPLPMALLAQSIVGFDGLTPAQIMYLRGRLSVSEVGIKPGQGSYPYVGGGRIIDKLNGVFGFGGWSIENAKTEVLDKSYRPYKPAADGQKEQPEQYRVTMRCELELVITTPGGNTFRRFGYGCHEIASKNIIDCYANAGAAAYTRAIRSAAITLGDQFGLSLMRMGLKSNWKSVCNEGAAAYFPDPLRETAQLRNAQVESAEYYGQIIDEDEEFFEVNEDAPDEPAPPVAQPNRQRPAPAADAAPMPQPSAQTVAQSAKQPAQQSAQQNQPVEPQRISEAQARDLVERCKGLSGTAVTVILRNNGIERLSYLTVDKVDGFLAAIDQEIAAERAKQSQSQQQPAQAQQQPAAQPQPHAQQPQQHQQPQQQSAPAEPPKMTLAQRQDIHNQIKSLTDRLRLAIGDDGARKQLREALDGCKAKTGINSNATNVLCPADSPAAAPIAFALALRDSLQQLIDANTQGR